MYQIWINSNLTLTASQISWEAFEIMTWMKFLYYKQNELYISYKMKWRCYWNILNIHSFCYVKWLPIGLIYFNDLSKFSIKLLKITVQHQWKYECISIPANTVMLTMLFHCINLTIKVFVFWRHAKVIPMPIKMWKTMLTDNVGNICTELV